MLWRSKFDSDMVQRQRQTRLSRPFHDPAQWTTAPSGEGPSDRQAGSQTGTGARSDSEPVTRVCNTCTGTTGLLFTFSLPQSPGIVGAGSWGFSSCDFAHLTYMPVEPVSVLEVTKKLLIKELMLDLMSINITVALEYCLLPGVVDYGGHENISSCWTCSLVTKH